MVPGLCQHTCPAAAGASAVLGALLVAGRDPGDLALLADLAIGARVNTNCCSELQTSKNISSSSESLVEQGTQKHEGRRGA